MFYLIFGYNINWSLSGLSGPLNAIALSAIPPPPLGIVYFAVASVQTFLSSSVPCLPDCCWSCQLLLILPSFKYCEHSALYIRLELENTRCQEGFYNTLSHLRLVANKVYLLLTQFQRHEQE